MEFSNAIFALKWNEGGFVNLRQFTSIDALRSHLQVLGSGATCSLSVKYPEKKMPEPIASGSPSEVISQLEKEMV